MANEDDLMGHFDRLSAGREQKLKEEREAEASRERARREANAATHEIYRSVVAPIVEDAKRKFASRNVALEVAPVVSFSGQSNSLIFHLSELHTHQFGARPRKRTREYSLSLMDDGRVVVVRSNPINRNDPSENLGKSLGSPTVSTLTQDHVRQLIKLAIDEWFEEPID